MCACFALLFYSPTSRLGAADWVVSASLPLRPVKARWRWSIKVSVGPSVEHTWQMSPSFVIRTHVSQSWRLMPLLQHIYLSPRYLSLQCLALYYHGWQHREPFSRPSSKVGQSVRDCPPGRFLQNFDVSAAGGREGGGTSEIEMKMLPKDFQAFMHLTKARKGRRKRKRWRGCDL